MPRCESSLTPEQRSFLSATGDIGLQAFDELHDVFLFVKDRERRFIYFNRAFTDLMGLASHQILGHRDEDLSPGYLVEHYKDNDEYVLNHGQRLADVIELVHDVDGSYDWFTTTKFPVRDLDGNIIGVAGITRSLTKHTVLQERISPLKPAIELISAHYDQDLTLADMARHCSLSRTHFARLFKTQLGVTPHRYLQKVRLQAACELLSTTKLNVSKISTSVGYYDQSHFTKDFVRQKGITPLQYRRDYWRGKPANNITQLPNR